MCEKIVLSLSHSLTLCACLIRALHYIILYFLLLTPEQEYFATKPASLNTTSKDLACVFGDQKITGGCWSRSRFVLSQVLTPGAKR